MSTHLPVLIPLFPLAAALAVFLLPGALSRLAALLGLGAGLAAALFSLHLFGAAPWVYNLGGWPPPWGIVLAVTPFTGFLASLFLLLSLFGWFYSVASASLSVREERPGKAFYSLLSFFTGVLLVLLLARDAFTLYLCLESALLAAAGLLLALNARNRTESFHLLLYGSAGASLFLFGLWLLYAANGTLNLDDLLSQLFISRNFPVALTAGFFTACGMAVPLLFPAPFLSGRLPVQTPPAVLGALSTMLSRGAAYLLFVFFFFVLDVPGLAIPRWLQALEYLAAAFFLAGFVRAFRQKDLRHAVAYLGAAQLGYLFLGFAVGDKSALAGTLLEFFNQVLVTAGLFFIAGNLRTSAGPQPVSRLAGLARHRPLTGLALVVFLASIAGVPPTAGFFGKFYLLQGALEKGDWAALALLSLSLAFNFLYFARLTAFLYEQRGPSLAYGPPSAALKAPVLALAAGVLLLGLFHHAVFQRFVEPALPKAFQNVPVPNVPFLGHEVE